MKSRERVLAALNHWEPDRIPFDLGSTVVTGIHRTAYAKLRHYLGLPEINIRTSDIIQQLALVDKDLAERLQTDCRGAGPGSQPASKVGLRDEGNYLTLTDGWGIGWRMPKDHGLYFDMYYHPLSEAETIEDVARHAWPDPVDPARFEGLRQQARIAHEQDKVVVLGMLCGGVAEMAACMRGYANYYMDLASSPAIVECIMDKFLELKLAYWDRALSEVGEYVDVVAEGEDLGSQERLLVSPQTYRKYIKPRHAELFSFIKKQAQVKVFLHSCGSIRPIIGDLIESGVDILNPIQKSAAGMDPVELKREFGKDVIFWGGGVSTQRVLSSGTPEQVRADVRHSIDALAPGGGFVFSTDHNTQADVPPENFMAMWETLQEYGRYNTR